MSAPTAPGHPGALRVPTGGLGSQMASRGDTLSQEPAPGPPRTGGRHRLQEIGRETPSKSCRHPQGSGRGEAGLARGTTRSTKVLQAQRPLMTSRLPQELCQLAQEKPSRHQRRGVVPATAASLPQAAPQVTSPIPQAAPLSTLRTTPQSAPPSASQAAHASAAAANWCHSSMSPPVRSQGRSQSHASPVSRCRSSWMHAEMSCSS